MKRGFTIVCLLVAGALALSGCDKLKELTEQVTEQVKQVAGGNAEQATLGTYAKGYNALIGEIPGVIESYQRTIPFDQEPSGEISSLHLSKTVFVDNALRDAKKAFEEAGASAPDEFKKFKPMADELLAACNEVVSVHSEAEKYYEAEDYKDDDYAKGKELHGKMRAAAEKYYKAIEVMDAALSEEEDKVAVKELEQYAKDKSYSYFMRYSLFEAKKLFKVIDYPGDKKEAVGAAVDAYLKVFNEFKTFADAQTNLNQAFASYVEQGESFVAAGKRFRREWDAEQPDPGKLNRERDSILSSYNTMVSVQNSLLDLEANGLLK